MVILAYGIKQPTQGDRGSVFFPALEQLCQRVASHKHDDIDSTPISGSSVHIGSVTAASADWTLDVTGRYKQTVTLPAGFTYDNCMIECRDASTKEKLYPSIERISNTQAQIFSGVNTRDILVLVK